MRYANNVGLDGLTDASYTNHAVDFEWQVPIWFVSHSVMDLPLIESAPVRHITMDVRNKPAYYVASDT